MKITLFFVLLSFFLFYFYNKKSYSKFLIWLLVIGTFLAFVSIWYFTASKPKQLEPTIISESPAISIDFDSINISNNKYFYWDNIDILGQEDIEITAYIDGNTYEGYNDYGEGSFHLPKILRNKKCFVIFKNENQEERVSTRVGKPVRLPEKLITLNPDNFLPKSKDDLGRLVHTIPDTMELEKWVTVSIRITKDTQMTTVIDANDKKSIAYKMTSTQIKSVEVRDLTVGTEMQAELQGLDNFAVKEITPKIQTIELGRNKYTEWIWEVKPLKEGNFPLIASISITKNINGQKLTKSIEVYRESISVFTENNNIYWYGLFGAVILLSIGFYYWLRKKRITKLAIQPLSSWLNANKDTPKSIFIGYAEEDQVWADKFYNYLLSLSKNGYVTIWYEKLMLAGSDRMEVIKNHLAASNISLLIVSADFLASNDCDELIELSIKQHEVAGTQVVPIVVRKCHWELTKLKQFAALPQNQKAISSEWNSSDEAIYQVVEELQMLIQYNAANNA